MFYLEFTFLHVGTVLRGVYRSKRSADAMRKKLAAEMAKGKFKNVDDVLEIKHDAGVLSVRPSDVASVWVVDVKKWHENAKAEKELASSIRGEDLASATEPVVS